MKPRGQLSQAPNEPILCSCQAVVAATGAPPTAIKTSLSVGIPTGSQPFVVRLRLIRFCLALLRLGRGKGRFWGDRVRPMDREPLVGLAPLGHSLASFNLAWDWSPPNRGGSRWDLVWVEVGTLDRGQLDMGGTRREELWSP